MIGKFLDSGVIPSLGRGQGVVVGVIWRGAEWRKRKRWRGRRVGVVTRGVFSDIFENSSIVEGCLCVLVVLEGCFFGWLFFVRDL